jgi:hypothetical protein
MRAIVHIGTSVEKPDSLRSRTRRDGQPVNQPNTAGRNPATTPAAIFQ